MPLIITLKKQTQAPVCAGFGVSKPDHALQLAHAGADGVIVGSAVVDIIEKNLSNPQQAKTQLHTFIRSLRDVL